jgi:2-polyprenyl-6-methoxyphenol hydroxylase-like FAD-dependent oxidoreductase
MIINPASRPETGRRVLIAGAGIAGLSLARALKDAGQEPVVIERSREWPTTTDIAHYLPANAVRALDQLGLGEAVAAVAHPISRQRVTGASGRTLVDLPVASIWGEDASCAAIRQSSLHEVLRAATSDLSVRLGTTIAARLRDGEIKLSDGSVQHYDVLVGADGVDSVVRTAGIGGGDSRPTGRWCWRFIAEGWDGEATHGMPAWPQVAVCSPFRSAKEPSTAMPISLAGTADPRPTGATTSTASASRSATCWIRRGGRTAPRSPKLISGTRSSVGPC